MKRMIALALSAAVLVGAFVASPAQAGKAKPEKVKFFLHGTETVGELDLINNFGAGYNKMDAAEPAAGPPKSTGSLLWTGDPQTWNDCAGMYGLPVWTGEVSGQIKGTMKLTLHTINRPAAAIEIEVWPDLTAMQCKSNDFVEGGYPEPVAAETVDLPPGHDETVIEMKGVNFKAVSSLLVQITPVTPHTTRILYDSADFASSLEFTCLGSSCS